MFILPCLRKSFRVVNKQQALFRHLFFHKLHHALLRDQQGFALVLVSTALTAIIGFTALVTDFGLLALNRQRLVNAADAAALAGAQELVNRENLAAAMLAARSAAFTTLEANGISEEEAEVSVTSNQVHVVLQRRVPYIFARALGFNEGHVTANSTAAVGALTSYTGIVPLCIKEQSLTYGQEVTLKYGDPISPGNFGALALGGHGAKIYRQNIVNGYQQPVKIGDILELETEPGNMTGPTCAIDERIARCTDGCTYNNFKPGCPRVLIVPMHRETDLHGRDTIRVTGFAAFFVDRTNAARDEIKGYFIRMVGEGEISLNDNITGPYGVKLLQ